MTHVLAERVDALAGSGRCIPLDDDLVRCVSKLALDDGRPPSYLYASGLPNRLNPRGVKCLYFSDSQATVQAEYDAQWERTERSAEPIVVFRAHFSLRLVIDLLDDETRKRLEVDDVDLFGPWLLATWPTRLHLLGVWIANQSRVTAVRYPSAACQSLGAPGWNLAVFPSSLRRPDRVQVLGRHRKTLEELP